MFGHGNIFLLRLFSSCIFTCNYRFFNQSVTLMTFVKSQGTSSTLDATAFIAGRSAY